MGGVFFIVATSCLGVGREANLFYIVAIGHFLDGGTCTYRVCLNCGGMRNLYRGNADKGEWVINCS